MFAMDFSGRINDDILMVLLKALP